VPHSGPFARGIHVTVQAVAREPLTTQALNQALAESYEQSPFVHVTSEPPRVKDVAGSNFVRLSGAAAGDAVAVMCVIDNLVKGAAGGAIQWMNRMLDIDEAAGLTCPAPGWT
jgi:N-acetyl-gamma-glutamyl-phosphate reductase